MRLALLNVRRSLSGRFARSSSEKYERYGVPAPVHLLANLAKHATGRQILLKTQVVQQLLTTLKNSTIQPENYSRIKAALFGLAHIAGNMPMEHDSRLMPAETIPIICRFAEECPVLSIRGTAFWAMNIIAGSEFGARAIASMGWEGNRHANVLDEVRSRLENLNTNNISVKETSTIRSLKNSIVANKCTSSESSASPVRTHQMLGRIHSDSMVPLPQIKELKKATIEICLENLVRPERTFTQESAVTSGFGSAPTEEEAAIPNKEAQQPLLPTVFPNRINAQINPMTTGTPVKLDELDNFSNTSDQTVLRYEVSFKDTGRIIMDKEKLKNPKKLHFSSPFRKQFGALPFEYPNALKVARNIDSDITYSFLTDNERNAICSYRELLTKTGEQNVMPVTISPGPISMPTSNWTFIALPCRVELMCQNIFVRSAANSKTKRADQRMRLNVLNTHIKIRCFHCSRAQNVDPLPDELIQEYKKRRAEVLRMISMLEIRGDALEVHLTKLYRESSIFTHPCMYADILELMAEFNYSVESRKFLHKLFWKAFRPL
uniref:Rapamycin-insensitive companion of mTOR domain-containing protein n=1 Tax=Acrobeloides nanus TaxID=290746 RepID=A0A914CVS1_9BILA